MFVWTIFLILYGFVQVLKKLVNRGLLKKSSYEMFDLVHRSRLYSSFRPFPVHFLWTVFQPLFFGLSISQCWNNRAPRNHITYKAVLPDLFVLYINCR